MEKVIRDKISRKRDLIERILNSDLDPIEKSEMIKELSKQIQFLIDSNKTLTN